MGLSRQNVRPYSKLCNTLQFLVLARMFVPEFVPARRWLIERFFHGSQVFLLFFEICFIIAQVLCM